MISFRDFVALLVEKYDWKIGRLDFYSGVVQNTKGSFQFFFNSHCNIEFGIILDIWQYKLTPCNLRLRWQVGVTFGICTLTKPLEAWCDVTNVELQYESKFTYRIQTRLDKINDSFMNQFCMYIKFYKIANIIL